MSYKNLVKPTMTGHINKLIPLQRVLIHTLFWSYIIVANCNIKETKKYDFYLKRLGPY